MCGGLRLCKDRFELIVILADIQPPPQEYTSLRRNASTQTPFLKTAGKCQNGFLFASSFKMHFAAICNFGIVAVRMLIRSYSSGLSESTDRRAEPKAMRSSVPMLNFLTLLPVASNRRIAGGMPLPPCRTSGTVVTASMARRICHINFGLLFGLQMKISNRDRERINTCFPLEGRSFVR